LNLNQVRFLIRQDFLPFGMQSAEHKAIVGSRFSFFAQKGCKDAK
jgi:hypothetical protein